MKEFVVDGVRGEGYTGGEAWREVCDAVVAGICHDLNDRLSALSGIVQLARMDGLLDESVGDPLQAELAKVENLVNLLRTLPAGRVEDPEPVRLADVVATAGALQRRHRGLEDVRVDVVAEADPIVHTEWSPLVRGVLLLVASAARAARARGTDRVVVRLTVEVGTAVMAVEPAGDTDRAGGIAEEARGALAAVGGGVRLRSRADDDCGDPSPAAVELRLPVWTG